MTIRAAAGGDAGREFWFPGRYVGGTALIVGPLLLLAGVLLRARFHFFFPQQLAAFHAHPALISAAYGSFLAGNILLWPAIATLARLIGPSRPGWALWGGTLVTFGLFARTFHAGIDHLAFQIVRIHDVQRATETVARSYGAFHVVSALTATIVFGWIVLATGAYLSGTLGLLRSIALASMAALMIGVLKGTSAVSVVCVAGLCAAMVPLGIRVLREPPVPTAFELLRWSVFLFAFAAVLFYVGQLG